MKEYVYKGIVYPSISKLSQATGVDACYLSKKLKKFPETEEGNEVDPLIDEILSKRNRTYQYNGVFYETAKDAARDLGIKYKALTNYLTKTDYDLEKAVELYEENREVFVIDGVEYPSKIDIARSLGVPDTTFRRYVDREGSIEAAYKAIKNKKQKEYIYEGNVYRSLTLLSKKTGIQRSSLEDLIKELPETEGKIEVDQLINEFLRKRTQKYQYNGVFYETATDAARDLGMKYNTLAKYLLKTGHDLEKSVELYKENREVFILDGVEYSSKSAIARSLGISETSFRRYVNQEGSVEAAYEAAKNKERKEFILNGKSYRSVLELAKETKIAPYRLRPVIRQCNGNVEKAIMILRTRDSRKTVMTKDGRELSVADLSMILGVKQAELKLYLNSGMNIEQIKKYASSKSTTKTVRAPRKILKMEDGKTGLQEYCIKNKLNYSCIYNMITEYGKTIPEAIDYYRMNGQEIPAKWIHSRYDVLLKHMLLDEQIDYQKVITAMRKNQMPLREAFEYVVVRDAAREKDFDPEWQHEIYSLYTDTGLSEEERQECVKAFYITPEEIKVIEETKEKVDKLERKLDLYEIAESIRDRLFTEAETAELMKLYKVSYQELKTIFCDFYVKFQNGVLQTDQRQEDLKNDQSFMNSVTARIDRYAKLMHYEQDEGKEELTQSSSNIGEENL